MKKIQHIRNHQLSSPSLIDVFEIAELNLAQYPIDVFVPYRLPFYSIVLVTQGEPRYQVDLESYNAEPNSVVVIPPQKVIQFLSHSDWDGMMVRFHAEALLPNHVSESDLLLLNDFKQLPIQLALPKPQFHVLSEHIRQLQASCRLGAQLQRRNNLLRHQLYALLELLVIFGQSQSVKPSKALANFQRFEMLLETHFAQQHQLQFYAAHMACTERSLTRACLNAVDQPAKTVIKQRIALEARRLLSHTNLPIKTIAAELGFTDLNSFTKFFKREVGVVPKVFRAQQ